MDSDGLEPYRQSLAQAEQELDSTLDALAFAKHTAELAASQAWPKICEVMRQTEAKLLAKLRTQPMDQYRLGRIQGFLQGYATILRITETDAAQLAELENRATILQERIADIRNLLTE